MLWAYETSLDFQVAKLGVGRVAPDWLLREAGKAGRWEGAWGASLSWW